MDQIELPQLFPSLQDLCKLKILSCADQYPLDLLAKLPTSIRSKLYAAMSVCDQLHYQNTAFCDSFDPALKDLAALRSKLSDGLFRFADADMILNCCVLNIHEAFESFDLFTAAGDNDDRLMELWSFIAHIVPHTPEIATVHKWRGYCDIPSCKLHSDHFSNAEDDVSNTVLIPSRHLRLPGKEFKNVQYFVEYCNLRSSNSLNVDVVEFLHSPVWQQYETFRSEAISKAQDGLLDGADQVAELVHISPAFPYLQKFLSSVESLKIGTERLLQLAYCNTDDCFIDVPYLLLCNIASNETASIRSLEVYGVPHTTVSIVAQFLCGESYGSETQQYQVQGRSKHVLSVVLPKKPISIESLSVKVVEGQAGYISEYVTENQARSFLNAMRGIVEVQMSSLRDLSIFGPGLVYKDMSNSNPEDYVDSNDGSLSCIVAMDTYPTSTFVKFVQQPQLRSLFLGDSPERYCSGLVMTFLATPASSDMELHVSLKKEIVKAPADIAPFPEQFPSTNFKFKSLSLGSVDSELCRQIVSLPKLELKKLHIPAASFSSCVVHNEADIKISHVSLCFSTPEGGKIAHVSQDNLGLFLARNSALSILEFFLDSFHIDCQLFLTINSALSSILSSPRAAADLKEIIFHDIIFEPFVNSGDHDRSSYLQFFSSFLSKLASSSGLFASYSYDQHVFYFFVLVRDLGVVLTIFQFYNLFSNLQQTNLIPALAEVFGEKKIKKIVVVKEDKCNTEDTSSEDSTTEDESIAEVLKQIAETVVVTDVSV